jgi:CHAT domain-containing protein/tetratricopeptide (TPR) repeat protein
MRSLSIAFSCIATLTALPLALLAQATPAAESWGALDARVSALYEQGDLPQAIAAAQAALSAATSAGESGRSLDRLGFLYYTSGDLVRGETFLRRSLETRQASSGVDSLEYAETANDLAMLLRDLRHMEEAKALALRSTSTREQRLGSAALPLAESLNTLGTIDGLSGEYATAIDVFERALRIHDGQSPAERQSEEYGTLCVNLAGTYQRLGRYEDAETTFRKGLDALRVKPGTQHPAYAASELAYAALEAELGHYADAERLYDEGGRLLESELGDRHPLYAAFRNNRGLLYQLIGNTQAAAADYQRSLDVKRALYGPDSAQAVSTLKNLAQLTYAEDRRAGEQMLVDAVNAYARLPDPPAYDFASVLVALSRAELNRGAIPEARMTAARAVEVSRRGLGELHPLFASATRASGLALAAAGDGRGAEEQLRRALAVAEQVHGPAHPDNASYLEALADVEAARGDVADAARLYARSLDVQNHFWTDVLEIGSERFKSASMASLNDPVPHLIAFQMNAGSGLPAARALAFEAVAYRKGRILEQARSWRARLASNNSADVRQRAAEWQALVGCRASLTMAGGYRDIKPALTGTCSLSGTDLAGKYERLLSDLRSRWTPTVAAEAVRAVAVLQERSDAVETSLGRAIGSVGDTTRPTVETLRRQLRDDEALIEFAAYVDERRSEPHYGAFVLDSRGDLEWIDLGARAPIDRSVGDLLEAARDWSLSLGLHERRAASAAAETATAALAELSQRVWAPLMPAVTAHPEIHRLRIAPDAALTLVPFEALSDRHQAIDEFTVSYVPAARDLMVSPPATPSGVPVVVVSPGASSGAARRAVATTHAFRADVFATLDAARGEAEDLRDLLPHASVFSGPDASEHHVKALHHPSVLHIVGHGVVGVSDACRAAGCAAATSDPATQAMASAAIVLEEAYGRAPAQADDGLLTALELEDVDLRGTEMLVLSQCQMASGLASSGEGVYGMRRAGQVAGVRTFVAPLWNVEDRVQRRLMKRFYEELASGAGRADALRSAKLAIRRSQATGSFLYWAPVILSGASDPLPAALFSR